MKVKVISKSEIVMASSAIIIKTEFISSKSTEKFVKKFVKIGVNPDLTDNMELNFEIDKTIDRLNCYLTLAKPDDAVDITEIYKDCYKGTYPFKEMEDPVEVRKMIIDKNYHWVLFKSPEGKTVGCFTYVLDMKQKKGYMRGLMVKRKYQSITNFKKLAIGSAIGMWGTFKNRIYLWYCENRTAHAKTQYISAICGCLPVAFFPNKDIFMNKVESDVFHIIYSEKALYDIRKKPPILISEINDIYKYVQKRYNLEKAKYLKPGYQFNYDLKESYQTIVNENKDKFGYHNVLIKIHGTDSYIKFLYTPMVQNIEKIEYHVNHDVELYVLLKKLKKYASIKNVRYIECFVSAYKPNHQKVFSDLGFKVRGYLPSWKLVKTDYGEIFEDNIVFNLEKGKISPDIQLIPEAQEIVNLVYNK